MSIFLSKLVAITAMLALYNVQVGHKKKWFNILHFLFYPGHLLLGLVKLAMG